MHKVRQIPAETEFCARWTGGRHTCKISLRIISERSQWGATSLQAVPGRRGQPCSSHKRWWHRQLASQRLGRGKPQEPHLPNHQLDLLPYQGSTSVLQRCWRRCYRAHCSCVPGEREPTRATPHNWPTRLLSILCCCQYKAPRVNARLCKSYWICFSPVHFWKQL